MNLQPFFILHVRSKSISGSQRRSQKEMARSISDALEILWFCSFSSAARISSTSCDSKNVDRNCTLLVGKQRWVSCTVRYESMDGCERTGRFSTMKMCCTTVFLLGLESGKISCSRSSSWLLCFASAGTSLCCLKKPEVTETAQHSDNFNRPESLYSTLWPLTRFVMEPLHNWFFNITFYNIANVNVIKMNALKKYEVPRTQISVLVFKLTASAGAVFRLQIPSVSRRSTKNLKS